LNKGRGSYRIGKKNPIKWSTEEGSVPQNKRGVFLREQSPKLYEVLAKKAPKLTDYKRGDKQGEGKRLLSSGGRCAGKGGINTQHGSALGRAGDWL